MLHSVWLATVGSIVLFCSTSMAQPTTDKMLTAWKERQDRLTSARFRWQAEVTKPKGSVSKVLNMVVTRPKTPVGPYPPQDHTFHAQYSLAIGDGKVRCEYEDKDWRETVNNTHHIFAFDGKVSTILNERDDSYKQGSVRNDTRQNHVSNFQFRAVMMTYRALDPALSPCSDATYRLTGRSAAIQGVHCVEVEASLRGNTDTKLWVDPKRGYLPVRHILSGNKFDLARLDVTYQTHPDLGWTPSSWSVVSRLHDGTILLTSQVKHVEMELDSPISGAEFSSDILSGAVVRDVNSHRTYLQRPDGSKRFISKDEWGMGYEQWMNTSEKSSRHRFAVTAGIGAALVVLALVLVLRRRRAAGTSGSFRSDDVAK